MTKPALHRSRQQTKALKNFFLNRTPCLVLLVLNCILVALLAASFYFVYNVYSSKAHELDKWETQDLRLKRRHGNYSFSTCTFQEPSEFNNSYCEQSCGKNAFIYRVQRVRLDNDVLKKISFNHSISCVNRYEKVECHEVFRDHECLSRREVITECVGTTNTTIDPRALNHATPAAFAPAIDEATLHQAINTTVLTSELIVRCPKCRPESIVFWDRRLVPSTDDPNADGRCYVKLETADEEEGEGWPAHVRFCENLLPVNNCTSAGQLNLPDELSSG